LRRILGEATFLVYFQKIPGMVARSGYGQARHKLYTLINPRRAKAIRGLTGIDFRGLLEFGVLLQVSQPNFFACAITEYSGE
jgi:hypothetical protein